MGIQVRPTGRSYVLHPQTMFWEFIPLAQMHEAQPKTLFVDQVRGLALSHCTVEVVCIGAGEGSLRRGIQGDTAANPNLTMYRGLPISGGQNFAGKFWPLRKVANPPPPCEIRGV